MATVNFPPLTMDTIQRGKLDHPEKEVHRLISLIGDDNVPQWISAQQMDSRVRMVCLEGMAIQKVFAGTHDAFFHGQESLPFVLIGNSCARKRHLKEADLEVLRPFDYPNSNTFAQYQSGGPLSLKTKLTREKYDDHDPNIRKDLISATAMLDGEAHSETPLAPVKFNAGVLQDPDAISLACEKMVSGFFPFLPPFAVCKVAEKIRNLFFNIMSSVFKRYGRFGSLFVICVPKEQRNKEIYYRAHPFGRACKCNVGLSEEAILDLFQKNQKPPLYNCSERFFPQYRLYAPNLTRKNGVFIFQCSPYPNKVRLKLEANVEKVLEVVDKFLCGNIEPLSEDHIALDIVLIGLKRQRTYQSNHRLITSSAFHILSFLPQAL